MPAPKSEPTTTTTTRRALHWHRRLLWLSLGALLVWVLSGLIHPLLSIVGPRPQQFAPPVLSLDAAAVVRAAAQLAPEALRDVRVVRLVPGPEGARWQLTHALTEARRYHDLAGARLPDDTDAAQAEWLARRYSGLPDTALLELRFQDHFDADYPAVNRLLPVYRVAFDTPDGLVLHVHTETGALTAISDTRKRRLQALFRTLHSFNGVPEAGRRALIAGIMLALLVTAGSGVLLWLQRRGRPRPGRGVRRWHRRLAPWLLPVLLVMVLSGLLHVVVSSTEPALRLPAPLPAGTGRAFSLPADPVLAASPVAAAGLVAGPGDVPYLWLQPTRELRPGHHHHVAGPAPHPQVLDLRSGQALALGVEELGRYWLRAAAGDIGIDIDQASMTRVSGYSPTYDFRHRRLPVVRALDVEGAWWFVDPFSGQWLERLSPLQRAEARVFSVLHKWNPVSALLGRSGRDLVQAGALLGVVALALLGMAGRSRRR